MATSACSSRMASLALPVAPVPCTLFLRCARSRTSLAFGRLLASVILLASRLMETLVAGGCNPLFPLRGKGRVAASRGHSALVARGGGQNGAGGCNPPLPFGKGRVARSRGANACEKDPHCQQILILLAVLHQAGVLPVVISYSSAISAWFPPPAILLRRPRSCQLCLPTEVWP